MVIFFDFYCPHCYTLHKELPGLKARYGDQLIVREVGYPLRESSIPPLEAYELAREAKKKGGGPWPTPSAGPSTTRGGSWTRHTWWT